MDGCPALRAAGEAPRIHCACTKLRPKNICSPTTNPNINTLTSSASLPEDLRVGPSTTESGLVPCAALSAHILYSPNYYVHLLIRQCELGLGQNILHARRVANTPPPCHPRPAPTTTQLSQNEQGISSSSCILMNGRRRIHTSLAS
jgi:hypothetical protein